MTLQQLIYFQKIANLQHYNKAAKALHVAQPSLSKSMALLEEELQVPLFEKHGRNIILTKYGKTFLEHVDKILNEITFAENHVHGMLDRHIGHINVAYISPFGHEFIPKMVHKFLSREENNRVTFSFREGFTDTMIQSIHNDEADVVFGSYEKNEPELEFFQIIKDDLILVGPADIILEEKKVYSLHDFEKEPFIIYDRISHMGKYTKELFAEESIEPNVVCESSDELSILALVEYGFGYSYLAATKEVKEAILSGKIKYIPTKEKHVRTLHMIYDKHKFHSPAVLDFIDFIKNEYA